MNTNRRDFIKLMMMGAALPGTFSQNVLSAVHKNHPLVIFLELKGGNDFLSTLIPFTDPDYKKLRPTLHISETDTLPISDKLGLHKNLKVFSDLFGKNELAIIQGIGYEQQSYSHFKSIDIWESGSTGSEFFYDGWAARAIKRMSPGDRFVDAIGLGISGAGPARGMQNRFFILENPERFLSSYEIQKIQPPVRQTPALSHIQSIQQNINETYYHMKQLPSMKDINFSGETFIVTVRVIKKILSGVPHLPYLKFTHEGYDTHSGQKPTHDKLMKDLNDGLTDLISFLKETGMWHNTILVTYSEFGRCPMENFSNGTDHGGSSCHFITGGRVKGGLYGEYPSFKDIKDFQFQTTEDYRRMFSEITSDFWGIDPKGVFNKKFEKFNFIKS